MQNSFYKNFGKRIFDFVAAFIGFIFLLPVFLILSFIIKISSKGSIFFIQKRVGRNFKTFNLYKFRTMVTDAPRLGLSITSSDDPRITKVGKVMRKYKLDELPQLLNVIKGDMSLVGPRPEVEKYVNYYKNEYEKILTIRPGITDLASIKYRDENSLLTNIEDKEKYYINIILMDKLLLNKKYITNYSFILDIKIILSTVFPNFTLLNDKLET